MDDDEIISLREAVERGLCGIRAAITADAFPNEDAAGGYVASLTEAVMGVTRALEHCAESLEKIAEAISERAE